MLVFLSARMSFCESVTADGDEFSLSGYVILANDISAMREIGFICCGGGEEGAVFCRA